MLPLLLILLLRDEESEICDVSLARPGLKIDFEEIFMEDEESLEVKQIKSSLVLLVVLLLRCGLVSVSMLAFTSRSFGCLKIFAKIVDLVVKVFVGFVCSLLRY
ncbi:hypothetical protein CFOL_v3_07541 [Cephalotus follicularis]|uniref:Uncharacterized protein n=1 Tax=Cephalotus follicularis TaxID=3775 RepID=A0A1Q3B8D5_CEPFO|nr:hypothetical protein CFOL_v3_07541 [Cephalotus follicularis]